MTSSPISIIARLASAQENLRLANLRIIEQDRTIAELIEREKAGTRRFTAIRRALVKAVDQLP